jgi:hypothetical protein
MSIEREMSVAGAFSCFSKTLILYWLWRVCQWQKTLCINDLNHKLYQKYVAALGLCHKTTLEKDLKIIGSTFHRTVLQIKKQLAKLITSPLFNIPKFHSTFSFILTNALRFNQRHHFMYKNMCLCFNKSVLNWTFGQSLLHPKKNPIAWNYL